MLMGANLPATRMELKFLTVAGSINSLCGLKQETYIINEQ